MPQTPQTTPMCGVEEGDQTVELSRIDVLGGNHCCWKGSSLRQDRLRSLVTRRPSVVEMCEGAKCPCIPASHEAPTITWHYACAHWSVLQAEHLLYGGPLLPIWLKQVFNAFISFECVPSCILTAIIQPVYKDKGKDPLSCNSYRGISITPIIMKLFEYALLKGILPVLQENGHPHTAQTAYREKVSCQDAIFACYFCFLASNLQHIM